jgi:hypothetical protein
MWFEQGANCWQFCRMHKFLKQFEKFTMRVQTNNHKTYVSFCFSGPLEINEKGPVLARLCGGDVIPDIVSSGSRMLVEFSTSPCDNPFHPSPVSYLPGFELDIEVSERATQRRMFSRAINKTAAAKIPANSGLF